MVLALAACGSKKTKHEAKPLDAAQVVQHADAAVDAAPLPPVRVEHAVWKMVDNRHAAHRAVDGELVLDASDIGFARYTRFSVPQPRWQLGRLVDGERAAIADRLASLEVPLTEEQAQTATQVTALVHGANKQAITLKLNGRSGGKQATVALEAGWQTIEFPIAKGRLATGENQLVFETGGARGNVAFSWIRIGSIHPRADQDPRGSALFAPPVDAIELAENASLSWYVTIPDGADLVADVSGACHIEVAARAGDDSLAGGILDGDTKRLDLSAIAGKVARLTITTRDCPKARISHPQITLHGPPPAPLPTSEPPRFVILWVMDALRADKVPVFTPGARAQTPILEELAKSSTVFRQYYVQGNESQTSHSSVWTGLYPAVHGVRLAGDGGVSFINRKLDIIADRVAAAGLYTIAVTGNGYVDEDGGYARGFKEFRNMMREPTSTGIIYGNQIVDAALDKLGKHRDVPAFLFLGTIDNHFPWIARKPWIDLYSPNYRGPFVDFASPTDLGFKPNSMGCGITPPAAEIERLRAIYDSDISYQDRELGRFIDQLKAWGIWDQTMLIVTADHGDEIFEDVRCGHGGSLRDSLTRVPLLVHDPARFPAGTIVDEGAEGVDVLPTILAALGQPNIDAAQGEPLESIAQGIGRGWPKPSYASMYEYAHAMRIGRWKARVGKAGVPIIGDLVGDPNETKDFAATRPIERRMLTDNLGMFLALRTRWKKLAWGVVSNVTVAGAAALDEVTTP
ncbi:MAG: sulfatase [Myxococcales bacterium]|nr:sulfatase [Myxococcales bacterium]